MSLYRTCSLMGADKTGGVGKEENMGGFSKAHFSFLHLFCSPFQFPPPPLPNISHSLETNARPDARKGSAPKAKTQPAGPIHRSKPRRKHIKARQLCKQPIPVHDGDRRWAVGANERYQRQQQQHRQQQGLLSARTQAAKVKRQNQAPEPVWGGPAHILHNQCTQHAQTKVPIQVR